MDISVSSWVGPPILSPCLCLALMTLLTQDLGSRVITGPYEHWTEVADCTGLLLIPCFTSLMPYSWWGTGVKRGVSMGEMRYKSGPSPIALCSGNVTEERHGLAGTCVGSRV
jgi:hypothetical protein